MPFRADIKSTYHHFMSELKRFDGRPIQEARAALYPMFGQTYFFEYYFLKDITYF